MSKIPQSQDESFHPIKDLNLWWFGYGSPVTLGVLRIILGLICFSTLAFTLVDFDSWYTEKGFVPLDLVSKNWLQLPPIFTTAWVSSKPDVHIEPHEWTIPFIHSVPRINLLSYSTNSTFTLIFYLAVMVLALMTAFGIWTRFSSVALALGVISIHHRDPLILHSGDTLLRLCLIYLAFSPCGSCCSLDRVFGLWKGKVPKEVPRISLWPQRLMQYQVALVYFTTVWYKWFGTYWKDGSATFYPENLHEFYRFPVPDFLHRQPFIAVTTYGTLVTELSLATLVFYKPLRKYVLLAGIAMHGYIEYRFNIPFFAFTIIASYLCFYEGEEVSGWAKRMGERLRRWRLLVQMPTGLILKPAPAAALSAMDPFSLVSYDPGVDAQWSAINIQAKPRSPFFASALRSLGSWPWSIVPGVWKRVLDKATEPVPVLEPETVPAEKSQKSK